MGKALKTLLDITIYLEEFGFQPLLIERGLKTRVLLLTVTDAIGGVSVEQVFGGAILLLLLWLILAGKVRIEREVQREREINRVLNETIENQRETIRALTEKDRETLHLLRELRMAAVARGDLNFQDMLSIEEGPNDD